MARRRYTESEGKSGGSALKRLKASLKEGGVIGRQLSKGKSKSKSKLAKKADELAKNSSGNRLYSITSDSSKAFASQKYASYVQNAIERKTAAQRIQQEQRSSNPFEVKHTTLKHSVMNKKVKGVSGKPGITRKLGEKKRMETINHELDTRLKTSAFIDRRIGEGDPNMSLEDKMLERYMRERKSSSSNGGSMFNLDDDNKGLYENEEEDGINMHGYDQDSFGVLTHKGQSIMDADDAFLEKEDDLISEDEDEFGDPSKAGGISKEYVKYAHFGGFADSQMTPEGVSNSTPDGRKKTKAEIMKEIIQKSKQHKHERQQIKDEDTTLMEDIDAELDDVLALIHKESAERQKDEVKEKTALPPQSEEYDRFVKELASEHRVQATDRLKTDEEQAREAHERLEKLEKDRIRRMKGLPTLDEENELKKKGTFYEHRNAQADDLGNNEFILHHDSLNEKKEILPLTYDRSGNLVNKEIFMKSNANDDEEKEEEGSEEESDEFSDESEEDDSEKEGSEEDDSAEESENEQEEKVEFKGFKEDDLVDDDLEVKETKKSNSKKSVKFDEVEDIHKFDKDSIIKVSKEDQEKAAKELPFTFDCPETLNDMISLFDGWSSTDKQLILERLRILYDIRLGGSNKEKLYKMIVAIFKYFDFICKCHEQLGFNEEHLQTVEYLVNHIKIVQPHFEDEIQNIFIERVTSIINSTLSVVTEEVKEKDLNGFSSATTSYNNSKPPKTLSTKDLFIFKLIPEFFSTSDLVNPVVSPAQIFMSHYISGNAYHAETNNIISSLVLCGNFYDYQVLSKRFMPEVYDYILRILESCIPLNKDAGQLSLFNINNWNEKPSHYISARENLRNSKDSKFIRLNVWTSFVTKSKKNSTHTNVDNMSILLYVIELINKLFRLWSSAQSASLPEMAIPILNRLKSIPEKSSITNEEALISVKRYLEGLISTGKLRRRPLAWQKFKTVEMKTYVPKFEVNYSMDRKRREENKDKQAEKRLQYEYKKEFKSAVRELRKDASFIARRKLNEQKAEDQEYKKKINKLRGILTSGDGN